MNLYVHGYKKSEDEQVFAKFSVAKDAHIWAAAMKNLGFDVLIISGEEIPLDESVQAELKGWLEKQKEAVDDDWNTFCPNNQENNHADNKTAQVENLS